MNKVTHICQEIRIMSIVTHIWEYISVLVVVGLVFQQQESVKSELIEKSFIKLVSYVVFVSLLQIA